MRGFESGGTLQSWGCRGQQLVTIEVTAQPGGFTAENPRPQPAANATVTWTRQSYTINGATATLVHTDHGTPTAQQLADPWAFLDTLAPPCPTTTE